MLKNRFTKFLRIFLIILSGILIICALFTGMFAYNNLNYDKTALRKVYDSGFKEKSVTLNDGTILNYAENSAARPALLLIHGQTMQWEDYSNILPAISKYYHVYAVDCHGHGGSGKNNNKYTCRSMGRDFIWFIENVIQEPCVISGHSLGAILAAWIAANDGDNVLGVILEDPPFFSVTPDEMQNTFVWLDGFEVVHNFLNQTEISNYEEYYIEYGYLWGLFGDLKYIVLDSAKKHFKNHPDEPLKLWYIPYKWLHGIRYINEFDLLFAETFYTGEWLKGISQEKLLTNITCPSIYIKAETMYGKDGVLFAANTSEDAEKVHELIPQNEMITIKSGHDIHFEKPGEFIKILIGFIEYIQNLVY